MKFNIGDKVKSTKTIVANANIEIRIGAKGVVDDSTDLSKFYGEDGKTYKVTFEDVLQVMVLEHSLELI